MPGGGDGVAAAALDDDDDDMMQCSEHPFKSTSPGGGICAFCLQEKLGKLVSSSSTSFLIHSSSSSSPSFRSDLPSSSSTSTTSASLSLSLQPHTSLSNLHHLKTHAANATARNRFQQHSKISGVGGGGGGVRIPFLLSQKNKKKKSSLVGASSTSPPSDALSVLKWSKSTTAPRSARNHDEFSNSTPRRSRGFWSFLHLPSSSSFSHHHHHKKETRSPVTTTTNTTTAVMTQASTSTAAVAVVVDEVDDSPNSSAGSNAATSSFGRKVSRSRSVGCGSRSFSGDFFERISTGFGDCTLRRVESQREGGARQNHRHSTSATMREKVRCGGLFGGFMMITSSSSSSTTSSSSYWAAGEPNGPPSGPLVHGRTRSWGWAFASPRRAFGGKAAKSATSLIKDGKREVGNGNVGGGGENNNKTANLAAIPSLLSVRG